MEIKSAEILDSAAMKRAISRIAYEILEKNKGTEDLALVGILRRGIVLADRLKKRFCEIEGVEVPTGVLDITRFRDDIKKGENLPETSGTKIDFSVENKKIVLVDDVLYTGRTVRAAIEAIMELGRPAKIELAVMIDRGHRELPIRADYVGKNVPTAKSESIQVEFIETGGKECVELKKDRD
ncbi:MAG: bifunctional pyr operon transcriptional regulator/uracil phosphoribosyltransferase PyrR [Clostridia bacterium]|nr:bifunctional pyr operon transcriptional regulator/uracil phosphoribosyltransferase PyrR [Clostridia bacterium]